MATEMTFEELLKKISPTLRRITYKLNGHFSFFNDKDLYQEALMRLWLNFKEGKLKDKTESYILQGCYFHLKNYIRKSRVKAKLISMEIVINDEDASLKNSLLLRDERSTYYLDYLNDKMLAEAIRNNGLTEREKKVLNLCSESLTTRQIGERLGISHVSVVKLMSKIRVKCRKYVEA